MFSQSDPTDPSYKNPDVPVRERVSDLLSRMTLEEKVSQMKNHASAIERLGIPEYDWWNECLHGVARAGEATVFPQAIGLAATWNKTLMRQIGDAISTEARAMHHEAVRRGDRGRYKGLTMWAPNINIFRDPRWGRGQETYGEDPFLTASLAVLFVQGLQGNDPRYFKTIATPKHFAVHSGPEPERHHFDAIVDERTLHEVYLPAFKACVQEGRAFSVMSAYNRLLGKACSAHPDLLQTLLRDEWGFEGYVVSDCGAIRDIYEHHKIVRTPEEAAAIAVRSGCDLNCGNVYPALVAAVTQGLATEGEIDRCLARLLEARIRLGMFDPPEWVPYSGIRYDEKCAPQHRLMSLTAARRSIVLLKNAEGFLPLRNSIRTIAVVGPNADSVETLLGNYFGTPRNPVTLLEGIRRKAASSGIRVLFEQGCGPIREANEPTLVSGPSIRCPAGTGLERRFYNNPDLSGTPAQIRRDRQVDLRWGAGDPMPDLKDHDFSIRWTGEIVPPQSGEYRFHVTGHDGFRLEIDGAVVVDEWRTGETRTVASAPIGLQGGQPCPIRLDFFQTRGDAVIRLAWQTPAQQTSIAKAVECARQADVAIVVGGLSPTVEGEEMKVDLPGFRGGDRTSIRLPAIQDELIRAVHASGTPTVLVLMSGGAVAVDWADANLPAILEAWYPGEEGGTALAEVLFGEYNPAGRLPVTFYRSDDDLPPFEDYGMEGRTHMYFRGEPLYPFGHGLSFTQFEYSDLEIDNAEPGPDDTVHVSLTVRNTGDVEGAEVIQLYVREDWSPGLRPRQRLRGFLRKPIQPNHSRRIAVPLAINHLAYFDAELHRHRVFPGKYEILVGASSTDIRLRGTIRVSA
ncbi:glycoside hydrolase family 3 C-terminal domain-containing protein [Candidatus Sumerlaeota bacterium]|nr:glycoside hydrolase family 3 C-terminal domain-containing protein [Candidatus Sumerlaeota bacterium]